MMIVFNFYLSASVQKPTVAYGGILCEARVGFRFLMDRASFWRKSATSGVRVKTIFLLLWSAAEQTHRSNRGREGPARFLV